MPGSCWSWAFALPVGSQVVVVVVAVAVVRTTVDIEGSYCCAGKGAVDVVGDWLDWEDIGFVLEEIHNLLQKEFTKDLKLSTNSKSTFKQVDPSICFYLHNRAVVLLSPLARVLNAYTF